MTPIFTEKESNGIYEANLSATLDNGKAIGYKLELDVSSIGERQKDRLLNLGLSLSAVAVEVNIILEREKKKGIANLYTDFNKRVEYEKDK